MPKKKGLAEVKQKPKHEPKNQAFTVLLEMHYERVGNGVSINTTVKKMALISAKTSKQATELALRDVKTFVGIRRSLSEGQYSNPKVIKPAELLPLKKNTGLMGFLGSD